MVATVAIIVTTVANEYGGNNGGYGGNNSGYGGSFSESTNNTNKQSGAQGWEDRSYGNTAENLNMKVEEVEEEEVLQIVEIILTKKLKSPFFRGVLFFKKVVNT